MRLNVTTGHGRNSLVEFNNIETLPLKVKILQVYCGFDHVLLFSDSNIIQSKRMCFIYSITVVLHFPLTPHRSTVLMASSVRTKTEKKTLSGLASAECSGWGGELVFISKHYTIRHCCWRLQTILCLVAWTILSKYIIYIKQTLNLSIFGARVSIFTSKSAAEEWEWRGDIP